MNRHLLLLLCIAILIVVPSCTNSSKGASASSSRGKVEYSLASMDSSGQIVVPVDGNTTLQLQDFALADGVYMTLKGVAVKAEQSKATSQGWLHTLVSDEVLAAPNSQGYLNVVVENLNSSLGPGASPAPEDMKAEIVIQKFPYVEEMRITGEDTPTGDNKVVQKYYRINLEDPKWKDLDRSEIVVMGASLGSQFEVFTASGVQNKEAIFDCTENPTFTIYHHTLTINGRDEILIGNPVSVSSAPKEIQGGRHVLKVPGKAVRQVVNVDLPEINSHYIKDSYYGARKADGTRLSVAIPYVFPEQNRIKILLPECEEDIYLDLAYYQMDIVVTVSCEDYDGSLRSDPVALETLGSLTLKGSDFHDGYCTVPYTLSSGEVSLRFLLPSGGYVTGAYVAGQHATGDMFLYDKETHHLKCEYMNKDEFYSGFYLFSSEGPADDKTVLATVVPVEKGDIPCPEVVWSSDLDGYVCENCPLHPTTPMVYDFAFIAANSDQIFEDDYFTDMSFGHYGRIGFGVCTGGPFYFVGINSIIDDCYGMYRYDKNDTETFMYLRIEGIRKVGKAKEYDCILTLGGVCSQVPVVLRKSNN